MFLSYRIQVGAGRRMTNNLPLLLNKGVIVTMDSDYLILAAQGATHARIAYAKPGTRSVGQLIQKLKLIHDVLTPAEMENHIEYL
jgi:hypothetical protein